MRSTTSTQRSLTHRTESTESKTTTDAHSHSSVDSYRQVLGVDDCHTDTHTATVDSTHRVLLDSHSPATIIVRTTIASHRRSVTQTTRTMTRTHHTTHSAGEPENRKPENPAVKQQPTIIRTVIIVITKAYSLYNIAQQSTLSTHNKYI